MTDRELALLLYGALSAVGAMLPEVGREGAGDVLIIAAKHLWPSLEEAEEDIDD